MFEENNMHNDELMDEKLMWHDNAAYIIYKEREKRLQRKISFFVCDLVLACCARGLL